MDAIKEVNGKIWVFAVILVGFCLLQAFLFVRVALRFNKKHNIYTKDDLKTCVKTGLIAAIGPGVNTVFLGISLLALVGSGLTFMRLGVIGAPFFELQTLQYAASAVGINLGTDALTPSIMTFFVFAMAVGTCTFVIMPVLTLRPIEMAGKKRDGGSKGQGMLMKILPKGGIVVLYALGYDYITAGAASATAFIVAFAVAIGAYLLVDKGQKKFATWALLLATVIGITSAQIVSSLTA